MAGTRQKASVKVKYYKLIGGVKNKYDTIWNWYPWLQSDSQHSVEDWGSTMKTLCLPVLLVAVVFLRSEAHPSHGRHEKSRENSRKRLQDQEAGIVNLTIHHDKVTDGSFLLTLHQHYHTSRSRLTSLQKHSDCIDTITKQLLLCSIHLPSVIMYTICKSTEMLNNREVKRDVYGKRQKWNFCRLSSAPCTVESKHLHLEWIVRDTFLFLYDLFKDKMKRIENQR